MNQVNSSNGDPVAAKKASNSREDVRSRNWCFTLFDYDDNKIEHLKRMDAVNVVFQEEVCPKTKKKHLQGHIIWKNAKSMTACKKAMNSNSAHVEVMKGTPKQSLMYCTKDETRIEGGVRVEVGEIPCGKGTRSDLLELMNKIKEGSIRYDNIPDEYPQLFVQYRNGLREACDIYQGTKRDFKSHVSVLYGLSGTGKSRDAFENDDVYVLRCNKNNVWFDGYNYNKTLVIDDFYGWIPFNMMLNLLDRYAMKVDVKGGAMEFNSKNIIITSNKSPLDWYPNLSTEHKIALLRRLDKVMYYNRSGIHDVMGGLTQKLNDLIASSAEDDYDELLNLTQEMAPAPGINPDVAGAQEPPRNPHEDPREAEVAHCTEVPPGNTVLEAPTPTRGVRQLCAIKKATKAVCKSLKDDKKNYPAPACKLAPCVNHVKIVWDDLENRFYDENSMMLFNTENDCYEFYSKLKKDIIITTRRSS